MPKRCKSFIDMFCICPFQLSEQPPEFIGKQPLTNLFGLSHYLASQSPFLSIIVYVGFLATFSCFRALNTDFSRWFFSQFNVYKVLMASPMRAVLLHRRFFGGGRPGHLKALTLPPPAGGFEVATFHFGSEVSFLKRFKVLENESIFQKITIFLAKKSIFSKKTTMR